MQWTLKLHRGIWGFGFPKIGGAFLLGPHNKDCNILKSRLGSRYSGKLPLAHRFLGLGHGVGESTWRVQGLSKGDNYV